MDPGHLSNEHLLGNLSHVSDDLSDYELLNQLIYELPPLKQLVRPARAVSLGLEQDENFDELGGHLAVVEVVKALVSALEELEKWHSFQSVEVVRWKVFISGCPLAGWSSDR